MTRRVPPKVFRGQRVLLVGLGLHGGGVATAKWLVHHGAKVRVTDTKTATQLAPAITALRRYHLTLHLGGHPAADWPWAQRIVVNPDVWPTLLALQLAAARGIPIDNEASIFLREFPGTVIGVTGTRGKTTTTLLLGAILSRVNSQTIISGNVRGRPMLDYLPQTRAANWAVLELSSYQLERLPVVGHPVHLAVLTNLKVDHLNRHGSMTAYAALKYRLLQGQTDRDRKVLNWDDPWCRQAARIGRGQTIWFSPHLPANRNGISVQQGWVIERRNRQTRRLLPLTVWPLPGAHNLANLLAAVAGARAMGVAVQPLVKSVQKFSAPPYRQELVRTYRGHRFINDTTATSPDGTLAAMAVYPDGLFIIGGTDKSLDVKPLTDRLIRQNIPTIFLPGSATKKMQTALRRGGYRRPVVTVQSMRAAVQTALALARPKQAIILSPGAASFGLFIHEFDRGDQFNQLIRDLP